MTPTVALPARRPGLRERKKAKTRAAIHEHALRLVRAQGFAATTVEQIAEAAEISPSTFFRYFPTKEDALLFDPYDPVLEAAFRAQPVHLPPLAALRAAARDGLAALPPAVVASMREDLVLISGEPALRARMMDELTRSATMVARLVAERVGRAPDDPAVVIFAWSCLGAMVGAMTLAMERPDTDVLALVDEALAQLEAGLPL